MDGHDDDNEHAFGLNRRDHLDELRQRFAGIYPPDAPFVVLAHAHQRVRENGYDPARPDTWEPALLGYLNVKEWMPRALRAEFERDQSYEALANAEARPLSKAEARPISKSEAARVIHGQKYSDEDVAGMRTDMGEYFQRHPEASLSRARRDVAAKHNMTEAALRKLLSRRV